MDQTLGNRRKPRFAVRNLTITINGKNYRIFNINAQGVGFLIDSPDEMEIGTEIEPMIVNGRVSARVAGIPRHISHVTLSGHGLPSYRDGSVERSLPPSTISMGGSCWKNILPRVCNGRPKRKRNKNGGHRDRRFTCAYKSIGLFFSDNPRIGKLPGRAFRHLKTGRQSTRQRRTGYARRRRMPAMPASPLNSSMAAPGKGA